MHEQDSAWRREHAEQVPQPVSAGAPVSGGAQPYGNTNGSASGATTAAFPAGGYQPAQSYQQPHFNYSHSDPNGPTGQWPAYAVPAGPPQPPGYPVETQRGSGGHGGRIALIAIGALALALVSGTIRGVVVR